MLKLSTTKKCERSYASSSGVGGGCGAGRSANELLIMLSDVSADAGDAAWAAGLCAAAGDPTVLGLLLLVLFGDVGCEGTPLSRKVRKEPLLTCSVIRSK